MHVFRTLVFLCFSASLATYAAAQSQADQRGPVVVQLVNDDARAAFHFLSLLDMGDRIEDGLRQAYDAVAINCQVVALQGATCDVASASKQRHLDGVEAASAVAFINYAKRAAGVAINPNASTISIRDLQASYTPRDHYWNTKAEFKASFSVR